MLVLRPYRLLFVVLSLIVAGTAFAHADPAPLSAVESAAPAKSSSDAPHLHVQFVIPEEPLIASEGNHAGLYFKLESGWHIYWKNAGDSGEPPHIRWTLPEGITAGPLQFPAPKRLPLGPLMDYGYEDEVLFPFTLDVSRNIKPGQATLHARVDWLVCREVCIPGKTELAISRRVATEPLPHSPVVQPDAALWLRFSSQLPQPLPSGAKAVFAPSVEGFRLSIETGRRETTAEFFPSDADLINNVAPQTVVPTTGGLVLELKKAVSLAANPTKLSGVVEFADGRNFEIHAQTGTVSLPAVQRSTNWLELFRIIGLAFLGGLLLNLMPCVFPVLFLKGLALVNSGNEERSRLRAHGAVYAAGIVLSFWLLVALLLGLRAAGSTLGWGFQFQSPVFLQLMAGFLFFLALSLAGQFDLGLTLTGAGNSLATRQGYTGSFFTGVLAVVVATPCTAPFMGAAVGYALSQSAAVTFAVFTALALGLAAPYVLLTLQPAWTRLLPRPGAWMEMLKQAIALPIFATVIWLVWVVAGTYGEGLLAALLGSFLMLATAGWFLGRWPGRRWAAMVACVLVLAFIAVSFAAPGQRAAGQKSTVNSATQNNAWEPWSAESVTRYLAQGRPVFVDFTASWCLSCQVNERVALNQSQVQQAFKQANVALLKADWTEHDAAISKALAQLGRSGVPAYALYKPGASEPVLLPEVLTPGIVLDHLR